MNINLCRKKVIQGKELTRIIVRYVRAVFHKLFLFQL